MTRKQRDIVLAACSEFELHGFGGASMERIAATAKVSKRTLYKHFPGKDAVFTAITQYLRSGLRLEACPEYDADAPLEPQLVQVVRVLLDNLNSDRHIRLSRIIIGGVVREPELGGALARSIDNTDKAPYLWLREAMRHGRLRGDSPDTALERLAGLARSVALWPRLLFAGEPLTDKQLACAAEECARFFLAYYRA